MAYRNTSSHHGDSSATGLTIGAIAIGALVLVVLDYAFIGFLGF